MSGEKDLNLNGEEDEDEKERILQRKLDEEQLEIESLRRIISAYLNYPDAADEDVRRYERSYRKLSPAHKENKNSKQYILTKPEDSDSPLEDPVLALLSHYPLKFKTLRRCISANTFFIMNMLQAFEPPFDMSQDTDNCEHSHAETADDGNLVLDEGTASSCQHAGGNKSVCCTGPSQPCCGEESSAACNLPKGFTRDEAPSLSCECVHPSIYNVPLVDVDKVRCIVRNIIRDWAVEGQKEREQCYKPILDELDSQFPDRSKMSPPACLVPGAGLGRLTLEISCKGFMSQGNEFSYYMMICSSFILNHTQKVGEWTIYPWIHSNCNSFSDSDQCRPVSIPDIHPASAGITEGFSMCGGDFVEVYSDPSQMGTWDAVVTCFFLDTAHNIIEYIEIISKILKDGGVWINFGPLLYHFAEMYGQDEMSIELSLEDVKKVALHYGFELEKEKMVETTYTTNPRSMMQNRYNAAFWTMRKKKQNKDGDGMDT